VTDTGADAFSNAGPAPSGVWAATGNFQAAEIPEEFRPNLEGGDDLPADFYWAQVLSDEVTSGYAGPRAPLCTFTTGPAGRVYLDLRMYLCDPHTGQYVCLRAGRVFFVVEEVAVRSDRSPLVAEEIGLRGGRRSLVGEEIASRAGRGALSPEGMAAYSHYGFLVGDGIALHGQLAPAGLGWLARLAVLAAAVGLDPPAELTADRDGDGDVDLTDFALLANSFGASGGATYTWDAEKRRGVASSLTRRQAKRRGWRRPSSESSLVLHPGWSGLRGHHVDPASPELHHAFLDREERVVPAALDVVPRMILRAALAHEDRARLHKLPPEPLQAAELRAAVTPVAGRTLSLLMCHRHVLLKSHRGDYARSGGVCPVYPASSVGGALPPPGPSARGKVKASP